MTFISFFHRLILFVIATPLILVAIYSLERMLGYYPGFPGWEVAQIAATEKDVSLCKKIIRVPWYGFLGPTTGESRISCVFEYASITKNPSICEQLMPSSYGLSCVGAAETQPDNCVMNNDFVTSADGDVSYINCRANDPKRTSLQNSCCLIARVAFVKSENDCSSLSGNSSLYDECLQSLAFKNGDPTTCDKISNLNQKAACLVNAQAIKDDPNICSGCKKRVQTLDEFQ